jgi:hypothetical protein
MSLDCERCGHYPCECQPMTDAQRTELVTLRARVAELEAAMQTHGCNGTDWEYTSMPCRLCAALTH